MDDWKPIDTAPRDGTKIQLAVIDPTDGTFLADSGWYQTEDPIEEWDEVEPGVKIKIFEEEREGHWISNYCLDALEEPTHWMPLQAPPSA